MMYELYIKVKKNGFIVEVLFILSTIQLTNHVWIEYFLNLRVILTLLISFAHKKSCLSRNSFSISQHP